MRAYWTYCNLEGIVNADCNIKTNANSNSVDIKNGNLSKLIFRKFYIFEEFEEEFFNILKFDDLSKDLLGYLFLIKKGTREYNLNVNKLALSNEYELNMIYEILKTIKSKITNIDKSKRNITSYCNENNIYRNIYEEFFKRILKLE